MMYAKHIKILFCVILIAGINSTLYSADSHHCDIRQVSSKKSDKLYDEITVNLMTGKAQFVSLDNMIKILKDYKVIELSDDIKPAQEIIFKEVAYRMLKQHYLPRVGDKIRVYKLQKEFSKEATLRTVKPEGLDTSIGLPMEIATVQDENKLKTLQWPNMTVQISTVIEKLWLERIGYFSSVPNRQLNKEAVLEAASILRRKFIQAEDVDISQLHESPARSIAMAAEHKIVGWLERGDLHQQDLPIFCEILIQYIVLSYPRDASAISSSLNNMDGIAQLKEALLKRIEDTTTAIKKYNPDDYTAFAMLQSLLTEISKSFVHFTAPSTKQSPVPEVPQPRHSA